MATQNFIAINTQHIWPGHWILPSGVLVAVIVVSGLGMGPSLGASDNLCKVSFVDGIGAAVQRLTAVAHSGCFLVILRVFLGEPETALCSCASALGLEVRGSLLPSSPVTSAKSLDLSVTQLPLL